MGKYKKQGKNNTTLTFNIELTSQNCNIQRDLMLRKPTKSSEKNEFITNDITFLE